MATEKSFQLYINKDNVKHYFTASGGVLNGAQISTKYITMRTSSTTATFTMNDAGRDVLFPSAAAIAHKIDVWAQAIATLNNSKNTINVAIAGQNAITTERIHTSLNEYTGSVSGSFTKSNTSAIYVIKIANGFHAAGVRDTSITAYFTQYFCAANKAGKGVKNISVSNAAPYEGETVTFSAELYNGANFEGWYSDEACTQLVSSNLTYSTTAADITLYAKATIDANLYNVSAVAGSEIASVSVSDSIVPDGDTATFTAQVNTGCSFEAWYSDDTYTTVVSTENPYTATITANTTLYAKAHRNSLNMSVGSAEHGTASVSATTVPYGNDVTFTFTPEDETWELYGWYSDSGLTQLVSEANPYTFTATEDVALYPKVGRIRYTITLTTAERFHDNMNKIMSYDYSLLTDIEKTYLKTGEFDKIEQSKIFEQQTVKGQLIGTKTASIQCPLGYAISIYLEGNEAVVLYLRRDNIDLTAWPYYTTFPTEDQEYLAVKGDNACYCEAVMVDGILSADATTPVSEGKEAIFSAEIMAGYTFSGWYSDRACTTLVSTDNPAKVTTPKNTDSGAISTTLTLYAKATKAIYTIGVGTAEHGSATVSKSTAYYGDTVTFNCTVDEGYEFNGWYSDEGLTQLVSEANPYTFRATKNITLYPKVEIIRYKITFGEQRNAVNGDPINVDAIAVYYDQLTREEKACLRTGDFNKIDNNKIINRASAQGNAAFNDVLADIYCPYGAYVSFYAHNTTTLNVTYCFMFRRAKEDYLSYWPYYWYQPTSDANVYVYGTSIAEFCNCSAVAKDGIVDAYATTPTLQEKEAIFEAELQPGYRFLGWYADEACTKLVSAANPARVEAPKNTTSGASQTSLTLYAKAIPLSSAISISLKLNGTWKNALAVFKKTNGVWVQQSDLASLFTGSPSGTESNYLYLGE